MAPREIKPITKEDIQSFIDSNSDFGLEIQVKKVISELGVTPLHGGAYLDPLQDINREYDFRFTFKQGIRTLYVAVECKNISGYSPVLVSCLPRSANEAQSQFFVVTKDKRLNSKSSKRPGGNSYILAGEFHSLDIENSKRYPIEQLCGKSVNQVTRKRDGTLSGKDSEIFDRWSQAISSLIDFSQESRTINLTTEYELHAFLPIVVIPDERLWRIGYDSVGNIVQPLEQVDCISVYIDKSFGNFNSKRPVNLRAPTDVRFSHIEFMTLTGFRDFMSTLQLSDTLLEHFCPEEVVNQKFP